VHKSNGFPFTAGSIRCILRLTRKILFNFIARCHNVRPWPYLEEKYSHGLTFTAAPGSYPLQSTKGKEKFAICKLPEPAPLKSFYLQQ